MTVWAKTATTAEIEENVEWIVSAEELCECCPWITVERVVEVGAGTRAETTAGATTIFEAFLAELVIDIALLLVRQYLVRFGNQFELLLCFRGLILVRVVLEGKLAVCLLDFILCRSATDAKDGVVILAHLLPLEHVVCRLRQSAGAKNAVRWTVDG